METQDIRLMMKLLSSKIDEKLVDIKYQGDISDFGNPVTASVSPPTYNSSGYFTFDRVNTQRFQLDALKLTSWTDPWTIETWMFTPTGAT